MAGACATGMQQWAKDWGGYMILQLDRTAPNLGTC